MSVSTSTRTRIYLSPPHIGDEERRFVNEAFDTNWVAPVGPHLPAFEEEMCAASGIGSAVCLSSGTAALHLALRLLGVQRGDEVFCSSFTFVGTANPILYEGGKPVFFDAEARSWNMDPQLLAEGLSDRSRKGSLPKAIIVAEIYGQCAQWDKISEVASTYGVPIIEDAAEAVGATYRGRWAGGFGAMGVYSFNGNKIITTSGGGMLVSHNQALVDRARKLATQAREPFPHYEHDELGFNYRMSNVLAGIGRGQLHTLAQRIERRRQIFDFYRRNLGDLPGIGFMPELSEGRSNRWLSCITVDPDKAGADRDSVLASLDQDNIEGRPLWKPMHLQPLYEGTPVFGGSISEGLFKHGLCLPSGSAMSEGDLWRVVGAVRRAFLTQ
jgi:pyridoxal phosphate-dependent aminotransferase EpsN